MSKVLKIVAGVALVAASFLVPGLGQIAAKGLLSIGGGLFASGVSGVLAGKPKVEIDGIAPNEIVVRPTSPRKWCFGNTPMALDVIYIEQWDSNKKTGIVLAHAGHLISSYGNLYIDGNLVSFSGSAATGKWAGLLTREQRTGTQTQTAMTVNAGGPWTADATMRGYAGQALIFTWDQEKNPRGLPTRIQQVGEGSPVYDPRLDSTRGGSGAHRADDQTTWEYANGGEDIGRNAPLVYLTYLLGWHVDGERRLGVGYPPDAILYDTFIEAANLAEANGWTFDGVLADPSEGGHASNLRRILDAFAGSPIESGGMLGVRAPHDDTGAPVLTVTADRLRGDIERPGAPGLSGRQNVAMGRYLEPTKGYEAVEYPRVALSDAITDDGSELPASIDLSATTDADVAQQLVAIKMREARQEPVRLTLDMSGFHPLPGNVIELDLADLGFDGVKVRAEAISLQPEQFTVLIDGKIVKASDYDLITPVAGVAQGTATIASFDELLDSGGGFYADGTPIDDLVESAMNKRLDPDVSGSDGGTGRQIAIGAADGYVYDGDVVTFTEPWESAPLIEFGAGGITNSTSLSGDQQQVFRANNLTAIGFIASLKLRSLAGGGSTTHTDGPGAFDGGLSPPWRIEKSSADQDDDDSYIFRVQVDAEDGGPVGEPISGWVDVGFYTRTIAGGAWTPRQTVRYANSGTYNRTITVDGLGADAAFGVAREGGKFPTNDVLDFIQVEYTKSTLSEVTATPVGASPVPYRMIGSKDTI